MRWVGDGVFVFGVALLFALIEIEIEGGHGWAKNLPTVRGVCGTSMTLYHVYMLAFLLVIVGGFVWFRLPCDKDEQDSCVQAQICWRRCLRGAVRAAAYLVAVLLVEDFLWFVLNPAFGLGRYTAKNVPWHTFWNGMPVSNYTGILVLVVLGVVGASCLGDGDLPGALGTVAGLTGAAVLSGPAYRAARGQFDS